MPALPPRGFATLVSAVLLGVLPVQVLAAPERFDPRAFFAGRTAGAGKLKVIFRSAVNVSDESSGHVEPDGTLDLTQIVHEGDKPARTRTWRIRETTPGHYSGTLSDAKGPVVGDLDGPSLHLVFTSLDGYGYEQWITVDPDGRGARNVIKIRKLGMTVAELDGAIRKLD